jgi:hypothetical protein
VTSFDGHLFNSNRLTNRRLMLGEIEAMGLILDCFLGCHSKLTHFSNLIRHFKSLSDSQIIFKVIGLHHPSFLVFEQLFVA